MKILIGTPTSGSDVTSDYAKSLFKLQAELFARRPDVALVTPTFYSGALVATARNAYASVVLEDPSITHLLFIDSDMGFEPGAVIRQLEFNKQVTGCLYPVRKSLEGQPPVFTGARGLIRSAEGFVVERGFVRTSQLPAGLMLIRRDVLERLHAAHPELCAPPDDVYRVYGVERQVFQGFAQLPAPTGLMMSEDYAFCERWRRLGGEMWALIDEPVKHVGWTRFGGGSLMDQWRARAVPPPG